jgi:hypothetical protein
MARAIDWRGCEVTNGDRAILDAKNRQILASAAEEEETRVAHLAAEFRAKIERMRREKPDEDRIGQTNVEGI